MQSLSLLATLASCRHLEPCGFKATEATVIILQDEHYVLMKFIDLEAKSTMHHRATAPSAAKLDLSRSFLKVQAQRKWFLNKAKNIRNLIEPTLKKKSLSGTFTNYFEDFFVHPKVSLLAFASTLFI